MALLKSEKKLGTDVFRITSFVTTYSLRFFFNFRAKEFCWTEVPNVNVFKEELSVFAFKTLAFLKYFKPD